MPSGFLLASRTEENEQLLVWPLLLPGIWGASKALVGAGAGAGEPSGPGADRR